MPQLKLVVLLGVVPDSFLAGISCLATSQVKRQTFILTPFFFFFYRPNWDTARLAVSRLCAIKLLLAEAAYLLDRVESIIQYLGHSISQNVKTVGETCQSLK